MQIVNLHAPSDNTLGQTTEHYVKHSKYETYRSFATRSATTQNLAFLSYWYRNKRLQMHFQQVTVS